MTDEYEPFGQGWESEMMKLNKKQLVKMFGDVSQENERLREQLAQKLVDQTFINEIAVKNGGMHMQMEGGLLKIMADSFASMIMDSGAENYLEVSFSSDRFLPGEMLVATIQRCKGKTPHHLRIEAENKVADNVIMPKTLTAENGAKAALMGEFFETYEVDNPFYCDCEKCEICAAGDPEETLLRKIPVSWTTIKDIYKKAVECCQVR